MLRKLLPLALLLLSACIAEPEVPSGAEDFATYCSVCHGTTGIGDGPLADGLDKKPADLTQLSTRAGGAFPGTAVMAQIWGYADGRDGGRVMPQFSDALEGELVPYDGGDGIATPTPMRLVQIAEYLRAIQK
jgi:mono/diheme cytochrome c family protein